MKQNTLNLSVFITLIIGYTIVLGAPDLLSAQSFDDTGGASFINLALICTGLGLCVYLSLEQERAARRDWFLLAYVFCVYLMREADFHTGFSGESLTKLDTYGMTQVPFGLRLTAALVLLLMTVILVYFLVRYTRVLLKGILTGQNWGIAFSLWFFLLLGSQIVDRKISTSGTHWKLTAIEELLEISAAIFAVLAIGQFARIRPED